MGVRKKSALRSQFIDIGSLCIWMSAEAANPIVLIIDRDEKDALTYHVFSQAQTAPEVLSMLGYASDRTNTDTASFSKTGSSQRIAPLHAEPHNDQTPSNS